MEIGNIPEWVWCGGEEEASIIATNKDLFFFQFSSTLHPRIPRTCEDVACDTATDSWLASQGLRMEYNGIISNHNCEENKYQKVE